MRIFLTAIGLFTIGVIACGTAPTPTPLLSSEEAKTALNNYVLTEISKIRADEERAIIATKASGFSLAATFEGEGNWVLRGQGMTLRADGGVNWVEGRWALQETGLVISPINSEAATLIEYLERWQGVLPTPTPSPTSAPAPTRVPSPTEVPFSCESAEQVTVEEISHNRRGISLDVNGRLINTCNEPVTATPTAIAYSPNGTIIASESPFGHPATLQLALNGDSLRQSWPNNTPKATSPRAQ